MNRTEERLARLRDVMKVRDEAAFLVTEGNNRRYLSQFTGSAGWLVITPTRQFLITDGRYWEQAERECPDFELFKFESAQHKSLAGALHCLLKDTLEMAEQANFCLELDGLTLALWRKIQSELEPSSLSVLEAEGRVRELRLIKDETELELLRRAAAIADSALQAALERFQVGQTERQLKAEIEYQILLHGGHGASFPTIVASGVNGSFPHAGASDKAVVEGELITIDFGAVYQGYCSDMTRTFWFGELPSRAADILSRVREAQARAVAAVKPGVTTGDLDAVARDYLGEHQLAEWFVHSLGHGIGLDVHEAPTLRKGTEVVLREGQVVTVEPGVYIPGFSGCRVEDTVAVTAAGAEPLNKFPKQAMGSSAPPSLKTASA